MSIETQPDTRGARIVGVDIPFWDLVFLLVKLSLAAIPAVIILAVVWLISGGVIVGLVTGFMRGGH